MLERIIVGASCTLSEQNRREQGPAIAPRTRSAFVATSLVHKTLLRMSDSMLLAATSSFP
jgi:hypothetical protein